MTAEITSLLIFAVCLSPASGQHHIVLAKDFSGGGYSYATRDVSLQPTKELPVQLGPNVALECAEPLCGCIDVGDAGSKVWFVLDSSDGKDARDRLYCDSDTDGTITESECCAIADAHEQRDMAWRSFGDIEISSRLADGSQLRFTIQPQLRLYSGSEESWVPEMSFELAPKNRRWGKKTLLGQRVFLCVTDSDCNGLFRVGTDDDLDFQQDWPAAWTPGPLNHAESYGWLPSGLGSPITFEGKLFDLAIDPQGTMLTFSPSTLPAVNVRFEYSQEGVEAEWGAALVGRLPKRGLLDLLLGSPRYPEMLLKVPMSGGQLERERDYTLDGFPVVVARGSEKWSALISTTEPIALGDADEKVVTYRGIMGLSIEPEPRGAKITTRYSPMFSVVAGGSSGERYADFSRQIVLPDGSASWEPGEPYVVVTRSDGKVIYRGPMGYT